MKMKKLLAIILSCIITITCTFVSGCNWIDNYLDEYFSEREESSSDAAEIPDTPELPDDPEQQFPDISEPPIEKPSDDEWNEPPKGEDGSDDDLTPDAANLVSVSEKKELLNGTYGDTSTHSYYGVGRTLNVIEDPFIEVTAGYKNVFDVDQLLAMNWHKTDIGKMEASAHTANSMKELLTEMNVEYQSAFSVDCGIDVFTAGHGADYSFAAGLEYRETSNEVLFNASQIYSATLVEVDGYYDTDRFSDILSREVLQDAADVQRGEMTPERFIALYGTHAVLAGYYGGEISCNYYLRNTGLEWDEKAVAEIEATVHAGIKDLLTMETSQSFSIQQKLGLNQEETEERFSASAVGGNNFEALSMEDFLSSYSEWVSSMNRSDDFGVIVGLPKCSLVAIWDLFPDQYEEAKEILRASFEETARTTESEFLEQYERYYQDPVDNGDTLNFAGGHGTEESPYLISEKVHFQNIANISTEGKYFLLTDSIDLSTWNSPFAFAGNLDGENHTITYYQRLSGKGDYNSGLFSTLRDATIHDLKIRATISRDDHNTSDGNVGCLAGVAEGNILITRVSVAGTIAASSYDAYDYIGGLLGRLYGGTIKEVAVDCEIDNYARQARIGGIVGYATPRDLPVEISNCSHTGTLTASSAYIIGIAGKAARIAGGIVGRSKADKAFSLTISNCYHDGEIALKWLKHSTGGTQGLGGILGQLEDGKKDNILVSNCFWQDGQFKLSGNAKSFNEDGARSNLWGSYSEWDSSIWIFSENAPPRLAWLDE